MVGERLVIVGAQRRMAAEIMPRVSALLEPGGKAVAVSVAGESGSGKSGLAVCLAEALVQRDLEVVILAQDDYFNLPPRTNHDKRRADIAWVGPQEVRLDLLDEHIRSLKRCTGLPLVKPLVCFEENQIEHETLPAGRLDVIIAEGTYTSLLSNVNLRIFIDRHYRTTRAARQLRSRDVSERFTERVLEKEHRLISEHRKLADIIVRQGRKREETCYINTALMVRNQN
ncbi:MAG TPA: hypothetical protein VM425_01590 [Myxococcota bacterium]|nr:hypothetical protein [Myxococcota bacterium]